jgi:hypothetical protein
LNLNENRALQVFPAKSPQNPIAGRWVPRNPLPEHSELLSYRGFIEPTQEKAQGGGLLIGQQFHNSQAGGI